MSVTFSQYSKSLDRPDGPVDLEEAKDIVLAYRNGQRDEYSSDQDPFAISLFNFCRDNNNFIQVAMDSKTDYRVSLECRFTKRLWKISWRSTYSKDYFVPELKDIMDLVTSFYTMEIEEFRTYFDSLAFKESKWVGLASAG